MLETYYNYEFAELMITFKKDIEGESSPTTEQKVIELMIDTAEISTAGNGKISGISKRAVLKRAKKLQEKGGLKRVGPARGGSWEITREEKD